MAYARDIGFIFRPRYAGESYTNGAWRAADTQRVNAEAEEKKRVLYVAVTRAQSQVVFVGPPPDKLPQQSFGKLLGPWVRSQPRELTVLTAPSFDQNAQTEELAELCVNPEVAAPAGGPTASAKATSQIEAQRVLQSSHEALGTAPLLAPTLLANAALANTALANTALANATLPTAMPGQTLAAPKLPTGLRPTPVGTNFRVTVTQLAHLATAPVAKASVEFGTEPAGQVEGAQGVIAAALATPAASGISLTQAGPATPATSLTLATPSTSSTSRAPLDASTLGELAHVVLAALGQRQQVHSDEAFVADHLGRQGYAMDDPCLGTLVADMLAFLATPLGRQLVGLPASARRHELPFQLVSQHESFTSTLHGQIDLAFFDGVTTFVVDYKYAFAHAASIPAYLCQLDIYAWALSRLAGVAQDVHCCLVYLRSRRPPLLHVATCARQRAMQTRLQDFATSHGAPGPRLDKA